MNNKLKNSITIGIVILLIFGIAEIAEINGNKNLVSKKEEELKEQEDIVVGSGVEIEEEIVDQVPETREEEFIEPLFDTSVNIIERIENYIGNEKDNIGFIYYNLLTQEKISFNENISMEAASTYKVGLNLVCYDMVQKGQISLNDEVYYNESQYQAGAGFLQFEEELISLPLGTLLDYSIIQSDNIAATMAYDYIGGWNSYRSKLFKLVGIDDGYYKNITSAEIEFKILKYLYENLENPHYQHLLNNMKQTVFHERLDKHLPYDIVAHKVGDMDYAAHDMGIVFTDEPYIIIMLTNGLEGSYDIIADVSKAIYNYNTTE